MDVVAKLKIVHVVLEEMDGRNKNNECRNEWQSING